jgi:hypothetical protein
MAFTDNCDLYAAFHEDGVNLTIRHIMRQRPSLFNYATADVASNRELWCEGVDFTADVTKYGNPIFTILDPLPVIGADSPPVSLSFNVQLTKAEIDFHPGNINLPPQLAPPLKDQRFVFHFVICGGIGCPSIKDLEQIPVVFPKGGSGSIKENRDNTKPPIPPVKVNGRVECFCIEVFVMGHFERQFIVSQECLIGKVDGVEIVDIKPDGLESTLECYIRTAITLALKQKLAIPLATMFFSSPILNMGTVTVFPTPNPPVPNNPAVEDDQLKAFITITVF